MTPRATKREGTGVAAWYDEYYEAWDRGDVDTIVKWVTDDVVFEDVTMGHVSRGRDKFRRFVELALQRVPDANYEVVELQTMGDTYWSEWIMQPMGVRGVSVGKTREGKISENRDYWNGALFQPPPLPT
jgi:ketosteroid isomerase-like protein